MPFTYFFNCKETPGIREAGGKALSLILTTRNYFPVPPGFVLTVEFFAPWFAFLEKTPAWEQFLKTTPATLKQDCNALKALCKNLELNSRQQQALAESLDALMQQAQFKLFAVRSSSPEEDLEGASFAGGYETLLGVKAEGILSAVRQAFASCLDERIFLYKQEHGFPVHEPRIAVIVQAQVPSDKSGVAFSLNPLNNCYDEVVINANFGLGESVVAGQVSPDQYVVDKVTKKILTARTGKKESAVWLDKEGGTYQQSVTNNTQPCLSDAEVLALAELTARVEAYYAKPMDIEWAFADNQLFLLQARPITAYHPLPEEMQTKPGAPKKLYLDMFLAKQGIHEAFSVLGLDYTSYIQVVLFTGMMGSAAFLDRENGAAFNSGGRGYANLTNSLKLNGKKGVIWGIKTQDTLSVDILQSLDVKEYTAKRLPRKLKIVLLKTALKIIPTIKLALRAFKNPEKYHQFYKEGVQKLVLDLKAEETKSTSVKDFVNKTADLACHFMNSISLPMTYAAEMARAKIKKLFKKDKPEIREKIVFLEQALPNNVTIEMGLAMYKLAQYSDIRTCGSGEEFASRLNARTHSPVFLAAWEEFMEMYGHRCPKEMDAATPRFYEKPEEFFKQLSNLAKNTNAEQNPQAIYNKGVVERERVFQLLLEAARSIRKEKKFVKYYTVLVTFGAYREIHKYYYIKIIDMFRKRILDIADAFTAAGRIENREQIFDLTVAEIDKALVDPALNLILSAEHNTRFLKKLAHIRNFPRIIDSRGKIFHAPKKPAKEGEIAGEPISPGKVQGIVKVLAHPDEKPLLPGEILVARATDPGWTPLFLNAGGIVLEVGGLLQHGALVAREYCKPCVAGIENVTTLLKDGQVIELDGANGIIRFVHA